MLTDIEIRRGTIYTLIRNVEDVYFRIICSTCGYSDRITVDTLIGDQFIECPECQNEMILTNNDKGRGHQ